MGLRKILALAACAGLPFTALVAAPAQAATAAPTYKPPVVKFAGDARVKGNHATVRAVYRCFGGNKGTHVWVSLKQSKQIAKTPLSELTKMEGTSKIAKNYYDTNTTDPKKVFVVCNGKWQHQTFLLSVEKGKLKPGHGVFLQFCLFDSTADPTGADLSKGFAFKYKKVTVHKAHKKCHKHHHHHH